ncbi:MAG: FAD-dependent oxidoreductase [Bacteroidia bacterium]
MGEKIVLVGGGLAGSLMSIYLAKRGYEVHLYERRDDMRTGQYQGGRSINLALSTRGITALEKVGLVDEILSISIPMYGRMMHSVSGDLNYQAYGRDDQAIYSVSRGELNIKLLQLADKYSNIHMYFNQKCVNMNLDENIATFENENGEKYDVKGDVFLATDGAFSALRDAMIRNPRHDFSQDYQSHGYKELEIVPGPNSTFQMEEKALHIWPRSSFMMIALPNPGGNFTCTLFLPYEGEVSFEHLNNDEEVMEFFQTYFPDSISMMPKLLEDFRNNPIGHLSTMRTYPWVKNRSALMGDAAHAIVPFYGQGMNCSFEDCVILDQCIEEIGGDWNNILKEYQKSRKPNADAIADLAIQNFVEMRDLVGLPDFLHKKSIEKKLVDALPGEYRTQYERVTFSNDPYREALLAGEKNDEFIQHIIDNDLEEKINDKTFAKSLVEKWFG